MKDDFKAWIQAAAIRAVKTMAQTAAGMIAVGAALSDVTWIYVGSVSLTAGILSILTSIVGLPEVELKKENEALQCELKDEPDGSEKRWW